jgi:predicted TIM-barrel fold metal-dependent hydrolase
MIVDLEHHYRPARDGVGGAVERGWTDEGQFRYARGNSASDVDRHLWFMDEAGIDISVLSGQFGGATLDKCKNWNDACARVVGDHPKRFAGFASVLPLGGDAAFDEMDRAVNQLGMKGVHISARPGGLFLDAKELWPFYEKVSELGVPIDVHVETNPDGYDGFDAPWVLGYVLARELDITGATFRLCLGGVLEDFPELRFIVTHFGGAVSALKDRMDLYVELCGDASYRDEALTSRPWNEYFDKLYFNMAGRGRGIATVNSALTCISPHKLMFATDWPPNFENEPQDCKGFIADIRALDLPGDEIDAMLGGAAVALLGLEPG